MKNEECLLCHTTIEGPWVEVKDWQADPAATEDWKTNPLFKGEEILRQVVVGRIHLTCPKGDSYEFT